MSVYYKIGEFAEKIGVSIGTLRRWDRDGTLKPDKVTAGGTRYYSEHQYRTYLGKPVATVERVIIGYARESPNLQNNLERQIENLKVYMYARGYQFEIVSDVGFGTDYTREGFIYLLDKIMHGEVAKIVVLNENRLGMVGYDLIKHICEIHQTSIETVDMTYKLDQTELIEDLMPILTIFANKLQSNYATQIKKLIEALRQEGGDAVH